MAGCEAELFFLVVGGDEDLAVAVGAVDEAQKGVGRVSHRGLRIAGAGEESSQRSKGKSQKVKPQPGAEGGRLSSGDKRFLRPGTRVKAAASVVRGVLVLDRCPSTSPNTSWLPDHRIAGGGLVVDGLVLNLYRLQAAGLTFRLIRRRLNGLGAGAATQYPT